jgi:hypothetical protein
LKGDARAVRQDKRELSAARKSGDQAVIKEDR